MTSTASAQEDDPAPSPPRPVCVLGMHRSGTSAVARLVNLLGVDLGPESGMLPALPDNPTGFWEQREVMELNDELLERFGGLWWRPPRLEAGWEDAPDLGDLRARAAGIVEKRFTSAGTWGFKDPRASLTLPFWRRLVPDLRFIVCVRHPADVAASVARREPRLGPSSFDLWLTYTGKSLVNTTGAGRLLVLYEDVLRDTGGQLERLARFVHGASSVSPEARAEAERFLDPKLRHHASRASDDPSVPPEAAIMFQMLRSEVRGPGAAAPGGPPGPALDAAAKRLLHARRERAELEDRVAALEAGRDEAVDGLRDARDELRRVQDGLWRAEGKLRQARHELRSVRARLDREARTSDRRRRDLRTMESSVSWRLTRPVRAAGRLAGRRRRAGPDPPGNPE